MKTSCFVSFEGPDGMAKTTHSKRLVKHLQDAGFRACYVKSPDPKSIFYDRIYSTLSSGWAQRNPMSFQVLQFANKMDFQYRHLPELRRTMDVIVMDRWDLSMRAYGLATGVPSRIIRAMSGMLQHPDHVFLLSSQKPLRSSPRDTYENDSGLQKRVAAFYNSGLWRTEYANVIDIEVQDDPNDTFELILGEFRF